MVYRLEEMTKNKMKRYKDIKINEEPIIYTQNKEDPMNV